MARLLQRKLLILTNGFLNSYFSLTHEIHQLSLFLSLSLSLSFSLLMYWSSLYLSLLLSPLFPLLLIITDYVLFYGQSVHHLFSTAVLSIHTIQRKSKLIVRVPHNRDLCVDVTRNKEKKRKGESDTLRACRRRKDTRRRANEQMNTKHPLVSTTTRPFHLFSSTLSVTATARTNVREEETRADSCFH